MQWLATWFVVAILYCSAALVLCLCVHLIDFAFIQPGLMGTYGFLLLPALVYR